MKTILTREVWIVNHLLKNDWFMSYKWDGIIIATRQF